MAVKRCRHCGRFFDPDPRVGERQQFCRRDPCRRASKKAAQRRWRENNPGYFDNHYRDHVVPWRLKRREAIRRAGAVALRRDVIKDQCRPQRLILELPAGDGWMIKDEILLRRVDPHTFAAFGP
jgi:hypothetical protein